jgi:archaeosine-15-forming tRNA-guanine transglycosylase
MGRNCRMLTGIIGYQFGVEVSEAAFRFAPAPGAQASEY